MKLTDLSPRWLTNDLFIFKSPTGHGNWLSCKRVAMSCKDQMETMYKVAPDLIGQCIVPTVADMAWRFEGNDFETMTVTPSIDASRSGNWHGFVTNGGIV
jgi:hypothetical protein